MTHGRVEGRGGRRLKAFASLSKSLDKVYRWLSGREASVKRTFWASFESSLRVCPPPPLFINIDAYGNNMIKL